MFGACVKRHGKAVEMQAIEHSDYDVMMDSLTVDLRSAYDHGLEVTLWKS
jgi:hypothetical protein